MKRLVLLLVLALVALPGLAVAQEACPSGSFQSYGEATSGYSVGCTVVAADIFSLETRCLSVDCEAGCPTVTEVSCNPCGLNYTRTDPQCGLDIKVNEFKVSSTCGTLDQVSAVGSTSGTMLSTASFCGDPCQLDANFTQTNYATSAAHFDGSKMGNVCAPSPCAAVSGDGFASTYQNFSASPGACNTNCVP